MKLSKYRDKKDRKKSKKKKSSSKKKRTKEKYSISLKKEEVPLRHRESDHSIEEYQREERQYVGNQRPRPIVE